MGKMNVKVSGLYEAGYKDGYKKGSQKTFEEEAQKAYFRGLEAGTEQTVEVCVNSILYSLYTVGWDAEQLKTVASMVIDAVHYHGNHPFDMKKRMEEMKKNIGLEVEYER